MEKHIEEALKVLETSPKLVPKGMLKRCKGIAIVSATELALVFSGGSGIGVLVKHSKDDNSWGPPAAISLSFIGAGANLAIANKFIFVLPMTEGALKKLTEDVNTGGGVEIGFACGPGVESEVSLADYTAPIYTYTYEKGGLIKAGISGTYMSHDKAANKKFYGEDKSPSEIVLEEGAVTLPSGNKTLDKFYEKLGEFTA